MLTATWPASATGATKPTSKTLLALWNVEPKQIPHATPPTHAMQIMRYVEDGSIRLLWVSGTNPVVSMPELARMRSILSQDRLFLVVQDIFLTETAQLADVVLPAAAWGEKTGTFTNADRTVHLSEKAVEPPGEARSDLEIFIDFARRMGLQDKDGQPLVKWTTAEEAFDAWRECSRGRPCDYSGLSYSRLRGGSGVQWPCTDESPDGTERLYAGGVFWASPDECESYGRDLETGAPVEAQEYRALNPHGRAVIKGADYRPPHELPDEEHPLQLITGRTVYHFHTRTRTARAPELQAAAPEVWVEVSAPDAATHGLREGDLAEVAHPARRGARSSTGQRHTARGGVPALPLRLLGHRRGRGDRASSGRAANELTLTDWDPASKQPIFKTAACSVRKVADGDGTPSPAPTTTASAPVAQAPTDGGAR